MNTQKTIEKLRVITVVQSAEMKWQVTGNINSANTAQADPGSSS